MPEQTHAPDTWVHGPDENGVPADAPVWDAPRVGQVTVWTDCAEIAHTDDNGLLWSEIAQSPTELEQAAAKLLAAAAWWRQTQPGHE